MRDLLCRLIGHRWAAPLPYGDLRCKRCGYSRSRQTSCHCWRKPCICGALASHRKDADDA
jgi:hypothetical protein